MRIAMFTNNYKPYVAGVPVSIEHLAEALRQAGHTVYVFAPSYEGQEPEEYVIRYPSFPIRIVGAPIPNVLTRLFDRKVRELEIDVIHVHHPALVGNIALMLRKKYGIPVVYTYHTRFEEYLHYVKPLQILERYTGILEKYMSFFCGRCDLVLAPTPGMKEYLNSCGGVTPVRVLPTGIPERNFLPDSEKAKRLRDTYGSDVDFLFCTVSRLAREKNLDFQLEGLTYLKQRLDERGKSFRHLFIGEGPEREHLQKRARELGISENITFAGKVENEDIPSYLKAADVFLFSSRSETQGIVILEAMAAGIPVVAVKGSGVEDVVEDEKNGFLTAQDKELWAERILCLTQKEEIRQRFAEQGRKMAERYSEREVAETAAGYYLFVRRSFRESLRNKMPDCPANV